MRKNSNGLLTLTEFDRLVKDMVDGKIKVTPQVGRLKAQGRMQKKEQIASGKSVSKRSILSKVKEGENFNRMNIVNIQRIKI